MTEARMKLSSPRQIVQVGVGLNNVQLLQSISMRLGAAAQRTLSTLTTLRVYW
jgi:hypothetical protein